MSFASISASAAATAQSVRDGETAVFAAARQSLAAIARQDPAIRAWSHVLPAAALDQMEPARHAAGVLAGVPVGIKDVIDVADMPTGFGAPALLAGNAAFDACSVGMLRAAGAIPVGKTVTAEFAFRTPGPTRNPHALAHTPGGSSSGSAAAVAAGMVPAALGTQTGGSMIRPAAYCGVVGFKPSAGRVFRDGMKLTCESLDTLGWYANSVADAQLIADVLVGGAHAPVPSGRQLTVAVQLNNPKAGLCAESRAEIDRALAVLAAHGVRCVPVQAERETALLLQAHDVIMHYEFARSLAPVVERQGHALSGILHQAVTRGLAIGAGEYHEMLGIQAALRQGWGALYGGADLVLTPSTPAPAPFGLEHTGDASYNKIWSVLGWPCLHLPTGFSRAGLPMGMQLVGDLGKDLALLAIGRDLHHLLKQQGE